MGSGNGVPRRILGIPEGLLWLITPQLFSILSGLCFTVVAARFMEPAAFALLGGWQIYVGLGVVIAEFGTAHIGVRWAVGCGGGVRAGEVRGAVVAVRAVCTSIGVTLVCLVFGYGGGWSAGLWVMLLALSVIASAANLEWWHLGVRSEKRVAGARLIRHFVVLTGAACLAGGGSAVVFPLVYVIAASVQSVLMATGIKGAGATVKLDTVIGLVRECWPLGVALIAQQLMWGGGLLWYVSTTASDVFGGLVIGYRCYLVGLALLAGVASYVLPRSTEAWNKSAEDFVTWINQVHQHLIKASFVLLATAPIAGFLAPRIFGDRYENLELAVTFYVWALIPVMWRIAASNALVAAGKVRGYCIASLTGAVAALGLVMLMPDRLWFAPILCTAFAEVVFALISHRMLRNALHIQ